MNGEDASAPGDRANAGQGGFERDESQQAILARAERNTPRGTVTLTTSAHVPSR